MTADQYNNDLRDVAWRTPLDCQKTRKSAPFTTLFDSNYSDQLVKGNAWKAIVENMETPAYCDLTYKLIFTHNWREKNYDI
jgi:hypothetical protein